MSACISCGLEVGGARSCDACGARQQLAMASSEDARCSVHPEVIAVGTCARCGSFMCVACNAVDVVTCRACLAPTRADLQQKLEASNRRVGFSAIVQGLAAPLTSWLSADHALFKLFAVAGLVSLAFGVVTVATRQIWILSIIACWLLAFLSFFAVLSAPLSATCVIVGLVSARLVNTSSKLERELWLAAQPK